MPEIAHVCCQCLPLERGAVRIVVSVCVVGQQDNRDEVAGYSSARLVSTIFLWTQVAGGPCPCKSHFCLKIEQQSRGVPWSLFYHQHGLARWPGSDNAQSVNQAGANSPGYTLMPIKWAIFLCLTSVLYTLTFRQSSTRQKCNKTYFKNQCIVGWSCEGFWTAV